MIFATLFLGGYLLPFQTQLEQIQVPVWQNIILPLLGPVALLVKVLLILFGMIWAALHPAAHPL